MRAMVLERTAPAEQNPLQMRELPDPEPAGGEVRLRVECCALCHTDLHTVEGDLQLPRIPVVPGHQVIATVTGAGPGVRRWREGDRVGVPWLYSTCGACEFCKRGAENLCDRIRFTGLHVDGGYAEAMVVPEEFTYALPKGFASTSAAPLLCAGVIGYRAYCLSGVHNGDRLGLYGFGASAHIVLQFARFLGCEIYVYTRTPAHQELARKLGAAWVGRAEDQATAKLDAAIIFAPSGALVRNALLAVRKGGTVALAGITMSDIPELPYELLYQERILRSVANSTRQDVREFLDLAADVPVQAEVQLYSLEQANQALQDLKHSRIRGAGVLTVRR